MKKFKKLSAMIMAGIMTLSFMTIGSFSAPSNSNSARNTNLTIDINDIEFSNDVHETGKNLDLPLTRGAFYVSGDYFDITDTLSANDAIDFIVFSLPTPRVCVASFISGNPNYIAVLGLLDTTTGNVTLSNLQLRNGESRYFDLPAGDYCWVILSANNTYTTASYRLVMNGYNPSGGAFCYVSDNLREAAFWYAGYPNNFLRVNGTDTRTVAQNFELSLPVSTPNTYATPTYERQYSTNNNPPATTDIIARLWATQDSLYFAGLGMYSSSHASGYNNIQRLVVYVELNSYGYTTPAHNMYMGSYFVYDVGGNVVANEFFAGGNDNGTLILDATTGAVIDWISPGHNMFDILGWGSCALERIPGTHFYF